MKSYIKRYVLNLCLVVLLLFVFSCKNSSKKEQTIGEDQDTCTYLYGICSDFFDISEYIIKSGENLSVILSRLGFSLSQIDQIAKACSEVLNPKRIVAGKSYYTFTSQDSISDVKYIVFANSPTDFSIIDLSLTDSICAYQFNKPIVYQQEYTEGVLNTSLWNAITENGGDPLLALKLSDIYAWQIDFFDLRAGDAFKVMYETAYIDDTIPLTIGEIKGAIFTHKGVDYHAIPFEQDSIREFFDINGNSLRKAFLKAPLDYFRITSRFSNSRFHPVLKKYRAHHGVDYAAPVGTPVKTIGDGTVVAKGFQKGGGGNYVKIKHNATYTTNYMHLSGFAKGISVGSRVQQGQIIGYVGSTGLSTGPHLDFRVYKNGSPIDPLKMESPPSLPVKKELVPIYDSLKVRILGEIDSLSFQFNNLVIS